MVMLEMKDVIVGLDTEFLLAIAIVFFAGTAFFLAAAVFVWQISGFIKTWYNPTRE